MQQEPDLVTHRALLGILEELKAREPIFHRPELGTTRADYDRQTDRDFTEVGASGRRYSREYCWDVLAARYGDPTPVDWDATDFHLREIALNTYLLTYTLALAGRLTRRLTVWQRRNDDWVVVFHQGTPVLEE